MKVWHRENTKLLEVVKILIKENFSTLHFVMDNAVAFVRGTLHLPENLGYYAIEIELLDDYPDSVPLVRETGGKIKRDGEHHIWTGGNCCLFVEEETFRHYPKGTNIVDFIQKVVTGHFLNQKHFELTGRWIDGDRSHGIDGKLEFYKQELKTNNEVFIYSFVYSLAKDKMRDYQICFCGSKKKLGNCHFNLLKEYRGKIKPEIARNTLYLWHIRLNELENLQNLRVQETQQKHLRNLITGLNH